MMAESRDLVSRLQSNAIWCLAALFVGTLVLTGSAWQGAGAFASGLLVMANFRALTAVVDYRMSNPEEAPKSLHIGFLAGRLGLLGVVLYAIFLMPEVGLIPVAVGLSVILLALLVEAFKQLLVG